MTAPPLCCLHLVFSCKWKMHTTCYSSASQQPLSQAQTHIYWSSECVGGQTPFHLVTSPYMFLNFSASFSGQYPSYVCLLYREGDVLASLLAPYLELQCNLVHCKIICEEEGRQRGAYSKKRKKNKGRAG